MNLVQEIITIEEEEAIAHANTILKEHLPQLNDTCDKKAREDAVRKCRKATAQKVRKIALFVAFRDEQDVDGKDFTALSIKAYKKVCRPAFIQAAIRAVLREYDDQHHDEIRPLFEHVEMNVRDACRHIMQSLHVALPPETTTEEAS